MELHGRGSMLGWYPEQVSQEDNLDPGGLRSHRMGEEPRMKILELAGWAEEAVAAMMCDVGRNWVVAVGFAVAGEVFVVWEEEVVEGRRRHLAMGKVAVAEVGSIERG